METRSYERNDAQLADSPSPHLPQSQPSSTSETPTAGTRPLYIYCIGWSLRQFHILDSDKRTLIYTVTTNPTGPLSSKPHITISNTSTSRIVGSVTFHSFSSTISLVIHNRLVSLCSEGSSHVFTSVLTHESGRQRRLEWKVDGVFFHHGDMLCVDEQDRLVARFGGWATNTGGQLVLGLQVSEGIRMDEIVVSGIAMMKYNRRSFAN